MRGVSPAGRYAAQTTRTAQETLFLSPFVADAAQLFGETPPVSGCGPWPSSTNPAAEPAVTVTLPPVACSPSAQIATSDCVAPGWIVPLAERTLVTVSPP